MAGGEPRLGINWMNMHTRVPQTAGANKNTNAIYMPTIRGLDARNSCDLTHLRQSQERSSAKQLVDNERQSGSGNRSKQNGDPVFRLQSGEDVVAEARLPDRGCKRGGGNGPNRGGAAPCHDDRRSQRSLDPD